MKALLTDLYQLTMDAAYIDGDKDDIATFDLFIRNLPKDWGYFVAAGIEDAVDIATSIRFTESDIQYLRGQELFSEQDLAFFNNLRFEGDISAVREGTPVTANTPILRVTAKRTQAQLLETILLNTINYQTMIASKAARIVAAAAPATVVDFGLRRAQGEDAGMLGARAAYIGGAVATSNVEAGKQYNIPITGTMAHSLVSSYPSELEAFRAYAKKFEDKPKVLTLLIDTYDTLSGAANAITVAKELEAKGKKLTAVRLDSGDICDLSKKVRAMLDNADLHYVKILASNDLNEYKITELRNNGVRIDGYGVGTEMITAKPIAAISGVYKLVEDSQGPKMKLSPGKQNYPGLKQIYRITNSDGTYSHDVLALEGEETQGTPILEPMVMNGSRIQMRRKLEDIRAYTKDCIAKLPASAKALVARPYDVTIADGLNKLVYELKEQHTTQHTMEVAA